MNSPSGNYYAHYYHFSVDEDVRNVFFNLTSSEDTYMYLIEGDSKGGDVLAEAGMDRFENPIGDADFTIDRLDAGSYIVEASTYERGVVGDFRLEIEAIEGGRWPSRPAEDGNSPSSTLSVSEDFDNQLDSSDWLLMGDARQLTSQGVVQLTPAMQNRAGLLLYRHPIKTEDFKSKFSFEIGEGGRGADGLGFVLSKKVPKNLEFGGSWNASNIDGIVVAFDTYRNSHNIPGIPGLRFPDGVVDPSDNFVSLIKLEGKGEPNVTHLATKTLSMDFRNNGVFEGEVVFGDDGHVKVYLSNTQNGMARTLVIDHDIRGFVPFDAYFGWFGATGGEVDRHTIHDVSITAELP